MSFKRWLKRLFTIRRKKKISSLIELPQELSEKDINENRNEIIDLLYSTERRGIDKVVKFLDKNDFFFIPSSINHHHNWRGGLAQHSLDVYHKASAKSQGDVKEDSLIIACLLHDVCKCEEMCYNRNGDLCRYTYIPTGHGARSIKILDKCRLEMLDTERRAIRWHMGGHNAHSYQNQEVNHTRREPLWNLLHYTDREDANRGPQDYE